MSDVSKIKGFDTVMQNLNREIGNIPGKTMKGAILAAAFIRNETEKTSPSTPVDLGNLRASWFVTTPTGTKVGAGITKFVGPKGGQITSDHLSVLSEAQSIVTAASNKSKSVLMMGYSASYAMWVHENIGAHFKRKDPPAGPKWLEAAIKRNTPKIVQIIRDNSQIPK